MRVAFVRTAGAWDRVYVARDDGSETSWSFASYGDELPHDLVHLVIEEAFAIVPGLWGRVAAGIDLGGISAVANRAGGKDKYRALGEDLEDVLLSEAIAGAPWWLRQASDRVRLEVIRDSAARMGIEVPERVGVASIGEARERLAELRARWRAIAPKGALTLRYPGATLCEGDD